MRDKVSELRESLRRKLTDDLQSASLANLVLRLVMPEIGRVLKEERDRIAELAEDLGARDFAVALRSGETDNLRTERDRWTGDLPFTQA
jgi:GAF domain-containing protein